MSKLRSATDGPTLGDARRLILEYAESLPFGPCFQHFDEEMSSFPGHYAPPAGAIVVAYVDGAAVGVVALRPLAQPEVCGVKRLYVPPAFQGLGIGEKMVTALIAQARTRGYRRMRLDTHVPTMTKAIALYRRLGFVESEPPSDAAIDPPNAAADLIFMELMI